MSECKRKTSLSKSSSLRELADFWDTHDLADYENKTHEVHFDVELKTKKRYVALDPDLIPKVRKVARSRGLNVESLVNLWVQQKVGAAK